MIAKPTAKKVRFSLYYDALECHVKRVRPARTAEERILGKLFAALEDRNIGVERASRLAEETLQALNERAGQNENGSDAWRSNMLAWHNVRNAQRDFWQIDQEKRAKLRQTRPTRKTDARVKLMEELTALAATGATIKTVGGRTIHVAPIAKRALTALKEQGLPK